jgi:hypothetical protein
MNPNNPTTNICNDTMMGPYSINTLDTVTRLTSGTLSGTAGSVLTSGAIHLEGLNADIKVNGQSLMETLRGIQDRLNMLQPNSELEAEWHELRTLGEQYRKLEAEFKEKSKMWNTLKK